jgi:hypothetical protein
MTVEKIRERIGAFFYFYSRSKKKVYHLNDSREICLYETMKCYISQRGSSRGAKSHFCPGDILIVSGKPEHFLMLKEKLGVELIRVAASKPKGAGTDEKTKPSSKPSSSVFFIKTGRGLYSLDEFSELYSDIVVIEVKNRIDDLNHILHSVFRSVGVKHVFVKLYKSGGKLHKVFREKFTPIQNDCKLSDVAGMVLKALEEKEGITVADLIDFQLIRNLAYNGQNVNMSNFFKNVLGERDLHIRDGELNHFFNKMKKIKIIYYEGIDYFINSLPASPTSTTLSKVREYFPFLFEKTLTEEEIISKLFS